MVVSKGWGGGREKWELVFNGHSVSAGKTGGGDDGGRVM